MNFYKNVIEHRGKLLVRGIHEGKEYKNKIDFSPTLYAISQEDSKFKTLKGQNLKPIQFGNISKARDFKRNYNTDNSPLYGMDRYQYQYIANEYPEDVQFDKDAIKIFTVDIECSAESGFPDVENPIEELLAITVKNQSNKQIITWGTGEFKTDRPDVTYIRCKSEKSLIMEFMKFWIKNYPDVITGWNTKFFDIPYLFNRIRNLVDEKVLKRFSPWNLVERETIVVRGRPQTYYSIFGISMLDYLDLYQKFIPTKQESYKLDYIGKVELGLQKDENPYDTFRDWYTKDFQSFIEYNITDVELVDKLEDKMKLIELALTMAYDAKVNYMDILGSTKYWDIIIYNYLKSKNIVIPQKTGQSDKDKKFEGAYVKEPQVGMHKWVMSFDLNSLYPHLIMQYNISPETLVSQKPVPNMKVEKLLDKSFDTSALNKHHTMTPNGALFRTDKKGFLPQLMEDIYNTRIEYKKKMLEAKQEYENTKDKKLLKDISRYNNIQMAKKISLNSAYGAIGNAYFRYYNLLIAEGITTSGQLSIRWIESALNRYLNKVCGTTKEDFVLASDTDSVYITFDRLVNSAVKKGHDTTRIINALDSFAKDKIEPFIDKSYSELASYLNCHSQRMIMKREVIADKAIWTAKKRYILNAWDIEGVRYKEPNLKMMGIEAVKSSTPAPCRQKIKEALKIIMSGDEKMLNTFIQDFRKEFMSLSPEEIAYPRSVNGLRKWTDTANLFKKGAPIHVKGAILYNHLVRKNKLDKKYVYILEGDKIKFLHLRLPNKYQSTAITFITKLPRELDFHSVIDYDCQYMKSFVEPLKFITDKILWNIDKSFGAQGNLLDFL